MATLTRERVQAEVHRAIDEHVPRAFRRQARLYVPMIVTRVLAVFEELTKGADDDV